MYQAKLDFLVWLLCTPPVELVDRVPLTQQFGQFFADWLWTRIRKETNRTQFGHAVMALANRAVVAPAEAKEVAASITHDAQFHIRWTEAGYELRFPRLHADWLDAVRAVGEPFYDWLASSGFDSTAFGLTSGEMNRAKVMKAFRSQSHEVCGYCDGPLGEEGSHIEANDCDHFFPKSQWPHLAIHPANLYSACMACNSRWKLDKRPMGEGDVAGLSETYHPMLRPGVSSIAVTAISATSGARKVNIEICDNAFPRRAETLIDTLDLEVRWENWVNSKLDRCVSVFVAKSARDNGLGRQITRESVRELIQDDIVWHRARLGKDERTLRQVAILEYQMAQQLPDIIVDLELNFQVL
ncbi:MAG: hypothetical protein V4724_02835 [Pseudomonadota bacterium]